MGQDHAAEESAPFRYDAYVSYSEADQDWVEDRLVPRLEEAGRRVCLEHHLPPGGVELEERSRAVAESRKTLVVVSDAYLEGRWSLMEEAVTSELDPAARKRRLIPILHSHDRLPLRIRPLVAVDLRRDDNPPQWNRLLEAVDPARPDAPERLTQRWSLRLNEATCEWEKPTWNGAGAAWLSAAYASLLAGIALVYLLLWEVAALRYSLTLLLLLSAHLFGVLVWREDRDLFRRLSHVLARSLGARTSVTLWATAAATAWALAGVPQAREILCGPWGCKEDGAIHLAIEAFDPGGVDGVADWTRGLHRDVAQKLQAVPEIEVFGIDLPQIDAAALRRLEVDYSITGRFDPSAVTASLWNRHHRPEPPEVTVPAQAAGNASRRLELGNEIVRALLRRLGVEVESETESRIARIPTDSPRAAELNDEGFALLLAERHEEAFAKLRQALALDGDYSVAWSNLADVAWRIGRYDEALEYRRTAVEKLPTFAPFHYNLGHLLAELGRDEEAVEALEEAVALDRAHVPAYNELGKALLRLGETKEAIEQLRRGLLLEPDFAPAGKNLGRALLAEGSPKAAVEALESALGQYPPADLLGRSEAHALLVEAWVQRGRAPEACRALAALRAIDPEGLFPYTPDAEAKTTDLRCPDTERKIS